MSISNGYATLSQVKAALRITDNVDDSLLEMAVESASRLIDGYAGRIFYNAGTATHYYAAQDSFYTAIDDAVSITTLETSSRMDGQFDVTWNAIDFQLNPLNGYVDGMFIPYNSISAVGKYLFPTSGDEAGVRVTGVWGFANVPTVITQACIIQASRIYKRLDSPLGVAGFGDLGAIRVSSRLDPDVAQLVDPYRRLRFA